MRVSLNVGLSVEQLRQVAQLLADQVGAEPAQRARDALGRALATDSAR